MNYMNHYEEINQLILKGKAIPTPIPHIRFSLILASMILVLIYLITENLNKTFGLIKIIYVILLLYFFIGIHILSVKSGILGMYLGLCIMSLSYFYQKNQLKKLIWIIPLLCGILISMIYFVPSLQLKYYHLLWQIGEWSRGKYRLYSDIERWQSIQFGWDIIRDHPILGSGIGDMKSATQSIYLEKINSTDIKYPHNQFVFTWAFTGLLGLISLCSLLYYSLVHKFKQSHFLSTALLGMIWFSLLVEHGFETELGICLFFWILLISWNLNRFNMVKNNEVIITEV